jgi:hypothetical protein
MACTETDEFARGMHPTGGLRPPLLIGARPLAGEKTPFAMHERILPGAAGVSPPWFASRVCNGDRLSRGGTFRPWTRLARATIENRNRSAAIVGQQERRASARRGSQAAFATATVYRGEARFDRGPGSHELQSRIAIDQRQSSVNKSGGRQPAVVSLNRACNGDRLSRGVIAFLAHDRHPRHGWLTPAALDSDVRRRLHRKARFLPVRCLPRGANAPRS